MNATGVVVEYNPFHNGHQYHLQQSRKKTNADCVIAVMSGNFLQRGEPAILDKWARTRMALRGGADLVIELPYAFATQHAEVFARGAVTILHSLKCKSISFGSESGDISAFHKTKSFLQTYDDEYNQLISSFIKEGISYPKAQNLALRSLATTSRILDLSQPNNILGYHYVSSIKDIGSQIQPYTVERKGAGYHDEDSISFEFASATGIRKLLNENNGSLDSITSLVPLSTVEEIDKYPYTLRSWEDYWPILQYKLVSTSTQELSYMYEVEEGIEHRLSKFSNQATCFQEFMNLVKTKRYTWTRIQRMLLHILTHTSKEKMKQNMHITSLRLLGMNSVGREYLRSVKKELEVPLITNYSQLKVQNHLDYHVSTIYSMGEQDNRLRLDSMNREREHPPVIFT